MSMKFLSGLQDLLGLYDSSTAQSSPQSPSAPIPPTTLYGSSQARGAKKNIQELNTRQNDESPVQRCSHERNVRFSDDLVTGYCEAKQSPFHIVHCEESSSTAKQNAPDPEHIIANYKRVCERAQINPSPAVLRQIGYMHKTLGVRQETLSLKGERVTHSEMEALEELFKAVQFDYLDFEYTFLDDDTVISLAEMLEFYDSTHKMNLSFNRQITVRGWNAVFRAVRNCHSLQVLNLRYTSVDSSLSSLCRCLRTHPPPALTCLHLENVSLSGKSLLLLVCALKTNTMLKELFLGENSLQPTDGTHLHQLIVANNTLQMLDLRNNELGDQGLRHICDALKHPETLAHSALTAIVLWNNRITQQSMDNLAFALMENHHLETLNIGSNALGTDGIGRLKEALAGKSNIHRLGLQHTNMNCEAAIILAECLADNNVMIRVDLRENPKIGSAGLLALHSAMKMNHAITNMNLDEGCTIPSSEKVRQYQDEFRRYFDEIREYCERNKQAALQRMAVKTMEEAQPAEEKKDEQTTESEVSPRVEEKKDETESKTAAKPKLSRFTRSSSLTCQETVHDIPERIRQMSGSTHSLDELSNAESTRTIKRFSIVSHGNLGKSEWGSLPALPQAVQQETAKAAPVVRKTRRFSVSPTSSTFNVSAYPAPAARPSSLSISIPETSLNPLSSGPMSAPISSSVPSSANLSNQRPTDETVITKVEEPVTIVVTHSEESAKTAEDLWEEEEQKKALEADVRAVVSDLVNYVVYEETSQVERKASLLLGTCFARPDPAVLQAMMAGIAGGSTPSTPSTTSRISDIIEELSGEESDEHVVQSVVRRMVRDVLKAEKDLLRQTLERRRKQMTTLSSSNIPPQ